MTPKLEKMILAARDALAHQQIQIANRPGGDIRSVFKGYIASLGPSLVSNGLLPAILIYEKENEDKKKISKVLRYLLTNGTQTGVLSEYLLLNPANRNYRKLREVADYTIALKLAISLFNIIADDEQAA